MLELAASKAADSHRLLTIQAHDGGAHDLLHAHELKQPSSSPSSQLLVAGPSTAEGSHLRSRRVRGDPHDLSERQLGDPVG